MSERTTITSEKVFDGLYALIKAKPWLVDTEPCFDESAEKDAIRFLLLLQGGAVNGWGNLPSNVRGTVVGLILDFLAKLRMPESIFSNAVWQVSAKVLPWQQAMEVVAQEIKRSHPLV